MGLSEREGRLDRGGPQIPETPPTCGDVVRAGEGGWQGRLSLLIGRRSLGTVWHLFKHLEMFTIHLVKKNKNKKNTLACC